MQIRTSTEYNEADQIISTLYFENDLRTARVIISDGTTAEIEIPDDLLDTLSVSAMSLMIATLVALRDATTAETEIPMLVDTSFSI